MAHHRPQRRQMPLPMQPQCGNKGLIRARLPSEELNLRQKWNERKQKKKNYKHFQQTKRSSTCPN